MLATSDYQRNSDSVAWFATRMWPKINGSVEFPVRFVVIGPGASPEVRNLTNRSNVIVRGGVEDLSPYYREVAVVPIRASGGTRIKLLEAAIFAVPIVTTSCGAAGMAFRAGTEVLIANQEAAFAKSCLLLLTNRQSALRMAAQACLRASEGLQSESVWPTPTFCAFLFERC